MIFYHFAFIKKCKNASFERKKRGEREKMVRISSSVGSSKYYLSPALFQIALLFVKDRKIKQ